MNGSDSDNHSDSADLNNNEKEARRWYRQGARDGETARKNAENRDFEVACFLYQQAAEKILKAFLYARGERAVLGHSTLSLARACMTYAPAFHEILDACRELDIFYIPTRYPNGLPDGAPFEYYTDKHAGRAEAAYRHVHQAVIREHPSFR